MNREVIKLINIGPKMAAYLAEIGITHEGQLRESGVLATYLQLKERHPHIMNRMVLYAIYGALTEQNCLFLPIESKEWLETQLKEVMGCNYKPPAPST